MSNGEQRLRTMREPSVPPTERAVDDETRALVRRLTQGAGRPVAPPSGAPPQVRGTEDRGTGASPSDDTQTIILIDEEELKRRLARPEPPTRRRRRPQLRSSSAEQPEVRGLPEKPRPLPPIIVGQARRKKPQAERPVRETPATQIEPPIVEDPRGTMSRPQKIRLTPLSGAEMEELARERYGAPRVRSQPSFEEILSGEAGVGKQRGWREQFYRHALEINVEELSFSRRLRAMEPMVEQLMTLSVYGRPEFEAENILIGGGITFALIEQLTEIIDGVVALGFVYIQQAARLGLAIEELRLARDRLQVLHEQLLSLARAMEQSGPLPLLDMQVMGLYNQVKNLCQQFVELGDALRRGQPFRYGRAAGHISTSIVGMVEMVGALLRPRLISRNVALSGDTALTGGVREIRAYRHLDGSLEFTITGELKPSLRRSHAPNFNRRLLTGTDIGLPDYENAHLWGPGFGDEARDGIMYAPRDLNRKIQNLGIESRLRELQVLARREGATIELTAQAKSYPLRTWRGHQLLKEANYRFEVRRFDGSRGLIGEVDIEVPPPGSSAEVSVGVTGGSAGPWSLQ